LDLPTDNGSFVLRLTNFYAMRFRRQRGLVADSALKLIRCVSEIERAALKASVFGGPTGAAGFVHRYRGGGAHVQRTDLA